MKLLRITMALLLLSMLQVVQAEDEVTLNFSNADIRAVIKSVSQITGKNFIVDPRVKGKVTVISKKGLSKGEVYSTFLSILQVHGFATIPSKGIIKIVPDAAAKQNAAPFGSSKLDDQLVTRVISIKNVNAAQLVPILRPLIAQQGHLAAYAPTNVLIVSDRSGNIKRIDRIISKIDIVSNDSKIELIQLEHAFATEVVRLLNGLNVAGDKKAGAKGIKLSADKRTNSIILSGEKSGRLKYRSVISQLDTPVSTSGDVHVIHLRFAKASNLAKILGTVGKELIKNSDGGKPKGKTNQGSINIQADEESNSLVITAPTRVFLSLRKVIDELDIARRQVHIEAIIAEVSLDTSNELGVQWLLDGSSKDNPIAATNFSGSGIGVAGIVSGALGDGLTLGLGKFNESGSSIVALIRALSGDAESNLLSTPSIVTLDNHEAEIVVGQNVPFVTGEFSSTGNGTGISNPFRTIERQDIGVSLKVKPQINDNNTITMKIEQEVSNISASSTGAVDLVTNKRSLKTVVQLRNGELLILGGLIDETLIDAEQKVPFLGDLPIIGALFRSSSTQKVKRNLVVFLKATIIKNADDARDLSYKKYNLMRDGQLHSFQDNELQPVLNELIINDPLPLQ